MDKILIVGAGPAGLWAAHELKLKGYEVLVIEQKNDFSILRRACSMQFIIDDDYEGEGVVIREGNLYFPKSDFSVPYTGKLVPLYNKYYHSPEDHIIRFARNDGRDPFSYKFDKRKLLEDLFNLCVSEGIEFMLGTSAIGGTDCGNYVELEVSYYVNGVHKKETVRGSKLVIAEGVNSSLCTKFGMNDSRMHLATALCLKYIVEGVQNVEAGSWNLYYGKKYHSNAAVIVGPSLYGDGIFEVTISGDKNRSPAAIYNDFTTASPMSKNFAGVKLVDKQGCSVKAYTSMKNPCRGNVIVIGDSAAFVEVEVQGALLCAKHAADAVEKELNGENGWEGYTLWWLSSFEFNGDEHMRVAQGYALVPFFTDDELDVLFGLAEGTCLYGTYSQYKTPKLIWDEIFAHVEEIRISNPDLYEKIQKRKEMTLSNAFAK